MVRKVWIKFPEIVFPSKETKLYEEKVLNLCPIPGENTNKIPGCSIANLPLLGAKTQAKVAKLEGRRSHSLDS